MDNENEENVTCISVYLSTNNGILLSLKKEGNSAICNNMNTPGEHYTNWNKLYTEKQILYDLIYMWNLK